MCKQGTNPTQFPVYKLAPNSEHIIIAIPNMNEAKYLANVSKPGLNPSSPFCGILAITTSIAVKPNPTQIPAKKADKNCLINGQVNLEIPNDSIVAVFETSNGWFKFELAEIDFVLLLFKLVGIKINNYWLIEFDVDSDFNSFAKALVAAVNFLLNIERMIISVTEITIAKHPIIK